MADYILDVVNQTSKLDWAFPFQRTGAFPLDRSSLFSSYDDAVLYASGADDERGLSGASYVGQPISVYDADTASVTLYIIEADRTLKEVGSVPVGDNLSIEIVDGVIQLKDFGKNYYAYIPAVRDDSGNIIEPSKYELTEGFKAGLEPRVISTDDGLAVAWYEPGSETLEDVSANVEAVSKTVDELDEVLNAEGGLVDQVDELKEQVGTAADDAGNAATGLYKELEDLADIVDTKANANDVYTKEQADEAIATAVAGADHLRRIIVDSIDNIDVNAEDAHLYIYMVPTGLQYEDDKYDEYVVIDGVIEKVGSWEVDLSDYATKDEVSDVDTKVNTLIQVVSDNKTETDANIADLQEQITEEVNRAKAAEEANAEAIEEKADKATTLAGYGITDTYTKNEITDLIADITGGESAADVKAELTAFKTTTNATLEEIQEDLAALEGAEPNYISSVDGNNFTVINGKLEFNSSAGRLITDEEVAVIESVSNGTFENFIKSVDETELNVDDAGKLTVVGLPASKVTDLTSLLNAKADKSVVEAIDVRVTDIEDILTWKDL